MPQHNSITLTDEQRQVVEALPAHYVVTAVAGSGKTTTLAHRIHFLLKQGFSAKRILILMFNKAAKLDFASKLRKVAHDQPQLPEVRTFHAMGYRLYSRFVQEGALRSFNKQVLSEKEVDFHIWRLLNQSLEGDTLKDAKRNKKDYVEASHQFIETVKNSLEAPNEVLFQLKLDEKFSFLPQLFEAFETWRKQNSRITYTDMLYEPVIAIQSNPHLAELVGNKMDIVLVDEYQDTNDLQHALLSYIAGKRAKVTVVGDPDQTIYEFRGAKPDYILKGFSQQFTDTRQLNLSYSFRYGHSVSLLANHLISRNAGRQNLLCKSYDSNPKTMVEVHKSNDDPQKVSEILATLSPNALGGCAILTRVWSQTVGIELALLEQGIPYQMDGYPGVFHSVEAQSLSALLELASGKFRDLNPEARSEKLDLLFHFPHVGLPNPQIKALCYGLAQHNEHWGERLKQSIPGDIKRIQAIKLERLARALSDLEKQPPALTPTLSMYFKETDLFEGIRSLSLSHDHAEEKIASIQGIARFLAQHKLSVTDTLELFTKLRLDSEQQKYRHEKATSVHLSTIHRAKGLEWDTVIIPGLNSKTLPYSYKDEILSQAQLESERRLLYVAMTRSKTCLHLLTPDSQGSRGALVSRFQHELNIEESTLLGGALDDKLTTVNLPKPSPMALKYAQALNCDIEAGTTEEAKANTETIWFAHTVKHVMLGLGEIKGESGNAFSVAFADNEVRTFSKETAERFFTVIR